MRTGGFAVLAGMAIAGCQTTTDAEQITIQAIGGDYCSATMPQPQPWDGSIPPKAGELGAWVVYPNKTGKLGGPYLAALVDVQQATVVMTRTLQTSQVPKFMYHLGVSESRIVGPGTNPPPPPCDYPLACAPMLVLMGAAVLDLPEQAYAKALACGGTTQKY